MKIVLGADHRGREAMTELASAVRQMGHSVKVVQGDCESIDYPDTGYPVAIEVATGKADRGLLFCGSGIGMAIVANKVVGIRAAVVHDEVTAERSRRHNNANVLCLPADLVGRKAMLGIIERWLDTEFDGGRHERRLTKIAEIERREMQAYASSEEPIIGEIHPQQAAAKPRSAAK